MEGNPRLHFIGVTTLVAIFAGMIMNVCAVDRLEQQIVDLRTKIEQGGFGGGMVMMGGGMGGTGEPGESSGIPATGWNGTTAEILFVEGAVSGGPLMISQKPKPQNDHLVNRSSQKPASLNIYAVSDGMPKRITKYIYDTLMLDNPDKPRDLQPRLVTSWDVSEDLLTYTFHLRKGVQFADGRPFTSADVKFSFDVIRDTAVDAEHLRTKFEDVEQVEIPLLEDGSPDPHTIVFTYGKEYWKGLVNIGLELFILNKGWYEEQIPTSARLLDITEYSIEPGKDGFGEVFNKIRLPCPGTGPYYYPETTYTKDGLTLDLVQNPFYWGIQVLPEWWNFKKIRWVIIKDDVGAFQEFMKQKFDVMVVDHDKWADVFSKDSAVTSLADHYVYDHTGIGYSVIVWNTRKSPFDDHRVRQAMNYLVDQDWILDEIERNEGDIAMCPTKPVYDSYNKKLEPYGYNVEKARELLTEAGWTDSDDDGILDKNGKKFSFTFKLGSGRQFYQMVTGQLQDACKEVGIKMDVVEVEWSTYIEDLSQERNFDAVCYYMSGDPWVDFYDNYHSSADVPGGDNTAGWRSDRVDQLLDDSRREFDQGKRDAMYQEFCSIYHEQVPESLLVHGNVGVLKNKRFENVSIRPTGLQSFDQWVEPENVLHK